MPKPLQLNNHKDLEVYQFLSGAEFYNWLQKSTERTESAWLRFAKKASEESTISYEEAREQAIIWGWIDGLINRWDDDFYLIKFSPRRPRSKWSKINRGIAEQLIKEKRMMPPGLAQVQAAKEDGRWDAAYDSPSTMEVPEDLKALLSAHPQAKENFEGLTSSQRYSILYRLQDAKRVETRQKRLATFLEMLKEGRKP